MGSLINLKEYEVMEMDRPILAFETPEAASTDIANFVSGAHNTAILERTEALTGHAVNSITNEEVKKILNEASVTLERIIYKADANVKDGEVPRSGFYFHAKDSKKILAFISDPVISLQQDKYIVRIYIWPGK